MPNEDEMQTYDEGGGFNEVSKIPPVTFLYGGGHDWMDFRVGRRIVSAISRVGGHAWFGIVGRTAGHVVFMDDPETFNDHILKSITRAHESGACNIFEPPMPSDIATDTEVLPAEAVVKLRHVDLGEVNV